MSASLGNSPNTSIKHRVLTVDDDPISLKILQAHLGTEGYEVLQAGNVVEAQNLLTQQGFESFDCIVTDCNMPQHDGLEFLEWLRATDPNLAAIMVTAYGEKNLVAQSLRDGACNFLEKPIDAGELKSAVAGAIEITHRKRHLAQTESAVQAVAEAGQLMQQSNTSSHDATFESVMLPKHQTGGDFIHQYRLSPSKRLVVLADVSGHDLKAAYISAYFQGVVRGMIEKNGSVDEILHYFNRFLVEEWNTQNLAATSASGLTQTSISVCCLLMDEERNKTVVSNCGCPLPTLVSPEGMIQPLKESSGPLGWFPQHTIEGVPIHTAPGSLLLTWSDGLEDFALKLGISPYAIAHRLLTTPSLKTQFSLVTDSYDDISLLQIFVNPRNEPLPLFSPIFFGEYTKSFESKIDAQQTIWEQSLRFALPNLPEAKLHDILLCSREALLNGLEHGCTANEHDTCTFHIASCRQSNRLRLQVHDPGPGYVNDYLNQPEDFTDALHDSYGLVMIKRIPQKSWSERKGASVFMEFDL